MQYSETKKGVIYTAVSFIMWGLFPLYWKLLEQLPALDILAHRIIWSFVFMCIVLFFLRQWKIGWQALSEKERRDPLFISCFYPDFDQLVCIHMGCQPWLFA